MSETKEILLNPKKVPMAPKKQVASKAYNHDHIPIGFDPLDEFEITTTEVIYPEVAPSTPPDNNLSKFVLNGLSDQYEKQMLDDLFVLGAMVLLGQWTVIYAQYNTGKTLLVFYMLMESISNNIIDPKNVYYINADDNHVGLTQKLKLAEEYGFNMVAPGHKGYKSADLLPILNDLSKSGKAHGIIIILDTLKKFTDLMDKRMLREFNGVVRMFISQGGTVIGLAHVNKKLGADGKPVYAGTSDIIDDADCAYVLHTLDESGGIKTVEFENKKNRGKVASRVAYSYPIEDGIGYLELLSSIKLVDDSTASTLRINIEKLDSVSVDPISTIKDCIREGFISKMKLAAEVAVRSGNSKRSVLQCIERLTGNDPTLHHWNFQVGERGAKQFHILEGGENLKN